MMIHYDLQPGAEDAVRAANTLIDRAADERKAGCHDAAYERLAEALLLLTKQVLKPRFVLGDGSFDVRPRELVFGSAGSTPDLVPGSDLALGDRNLGLALGAGESGVAATTAATETSAPTVARGHDREGTGGAALVSRALSRPAPQPSRNAPRRRPPT